MSESLLSSRNLAFELYEVLDAEALIRRERFASILARRLMQRLARRGPLPRSSSHRTTARLTKTSRATRMAPRC